MDPMQRMLLEEVWRALEDAGSPPAVGRNELAQTGVFVGALRSEYRSSIDASPNKAEYV